MRELRVVVVLLLVPCLVNAYRWTACIDPGHGGTDPGTQCQNEALTEARLAFEIGMTLYYLLQSEFGEGNVSITRSAYRDPSQWERARIGQGVLRDAFGNLVRGDDSDTSFTRHVDEFVSIHFNTWDSQENGTQVYVYATSGDRDHPLPAPPMDSSFAMSRDIISCFVLATGSKKQGMPCSWDSACARENGKEWHLPEDSEFQPPNDGIMGRCDLDVLNDEGWRTANVWKARCLLECEFMNTEFCDYMADCEYRYIDLAADAICYALKMYRQRADPGGRERIVQGR